MDKNELMYVSLIASVGSARSYFIEAIKAAKQNDFELANKKMELGKEQFQAGHRVHGEILAMHAQESIAVPMLLIHAEDQLMSAESFSILAVEFIDVYKGIEKKEK
jgi:PTS system cellobiose-specific IIA component